MNGVSQPLKCNGHLLALNMCTTCQFSILSKREQTHSTENVLGDSAFGFSLGQTAYASSLVSDPDIVHLQHHRNYAVWSFPQTPDTYGPQPLSQSKCDPQKQPKSQCLPALPAPLVTMKEGDQSPMVVTKVTNSRKILRKSSLEAYLPNAPRKCANNVMSMFESIICTIEDMKSNAFIGPKGATVTSVHFITIAVALSSIYFYKLFMTK